MAKVDAVVIQETKYIAFWVLVFSLLMQAVFLIVGQWNYTVLLGNLLGALLAVLNFFLMGLSVQKALTKDEKDAKSVMKLSHTYRMLLNVVCVALGVSLSCFNTIALLVALFFPRIAIAIRPIIKKNEE